MTMTIAPSLLGATAILIAAVLLLIHQHLVHRAVAGKDIEIAGIEAHTNDQLAEVLAHAEARHRAAALGVKDHAARVEADNARLRDLIARAEIEMTIRPQAHPIVVDLAHNGPLHLEGLIVEHGPTAVAEVSDLLVTGEVVSTMSRHGRVFSFADPSSRYAQAALPAGSADDEVVDAELLDTFDLAPSDYAELLDHLASA